MTWKPRKPLNRPNPAQALAARNWQRPLDAEAQTAPKRQRRKFVENSADGIGGTDDYEPPE